MGWLVVFACISYAARWAPLRVRLVTLMRFVWEITDFPYTGWLKTITAPVGAIIDHLRFNTFLIQRIKKYNNLPFAYRFLGFGMRFSFQPQTSPQTPPNMWAVWLTLSELVTRSIISSPM